MARRFKERLTKLTERSGAYEYFRFNETTPDSFDGASFNQNTILDDPYWPVISDNWWANRIEQLNRARNNGK